VITYEENPLAHVKTEFGFDVLEVAQDVMLPVVTMTSSALRFQFLCWSKAFQETYGLDLKSVLSDEDKVLGSYRYMMSARFSPKRPALPGA